MKVYNDNDDIYDAVDAILEHGLAVYGGTKTPAKRFTDRLRECLRPYDEISPQLGFKLVQNEGYYYYVYDSNHFSIHSEELNNIIDKIDSENKI